MTCNCDRPYCVDPRHFIVETTTTSTQAPRSLKRPRQEEEDDDDDHDHKDHDDFNAKRINAEPEDETFEPVEAATTPSTSRSRTLSLEPEVNDDNANRITLPSIVENIYYVVATAGPFSDSEDVDFSNVQLPPLQSHFATYSDGVIPDYLRGEIDEEDVTELPNGLHVLIAAFPETEHGLLMEIEQDGDPERSAFEALIDGDAIAWP